MEKHKVKQDSRAFQLVRIYIHLDFFLAMSVSVVERIVGAVKRPCLTPLTETGSNFLLQCTRTNNLILIQSFVLQDMLDWLKKQIVPLV